MDAEGVVDDDVVSPASLIGFAASQMKCNGFNCPWIWGRTDGRPLRELSPCEFMICGDSVDDIADGEEELRDGEDALGSLRFVGPEVLPGAKASPQAKGDGGKEETIEWGGVSSLERRLEGVVDPPELFKGEWGTDGLWWRFPLRNWGVVSPCVSLEDFFENGGR